MKAKIARVSLKLAAALFLCFVLTRFDFYYVESLLYDARFKLSPSSDPSGAVELVAIDPHTLTDLGREPNLIDLALVIRNINRDAPLAIASLLPPPSKDSSTSERIFLANVLSQIPHFTYGIDDFFGEAEIANYKLPPPLQFVKVAPAGFTSDKDKLASDEVTRRLALYFDKTYFLPSQLAQIINPVSDPLSYRGAFNYYDIIQTLTDVRRNDTYKPVSFIDILEDRFPHNTFRGKIVVIGKDAKNWTKDYVKTPFGRDVLAMSKLEYFASQVDTLIEDTGVVRPHPWVNYIITLLVCMLTLYFVFNLAPVRGLSVLLMLGATYTLIAFVLFAFFRVSITMTHPLLAIFVSYYFFIPYRLIQESRKSWEYQQKNKLLTEVEQLKTNFLSMMSHDLKTPLARIQGMADVALTHPENLTPEQMTALNTIGQSTDELSTFISSILDLGRVESQEVKLHLQSRDINSLLEEVISKYEYMAKSKNIEIVKEFEPLFSTKIDVALMRQVFANLVENAIKYSPEGSKVLISTEEVDGKIQVQVADQGIGIPANEIYNVFLKFYRSQGVKNGPIKGSGLGLFLAKYFVELHKGEIAVESVPEQGSTFTVDLPMQ